LARLRVTDIVAAALSLAVAHWPGRRGLDQTYAALVARGIP